MVFFGFISQQVIKFDLTSVANSILLYFNLKTKANQAGRVISIFSNALEDTMKDPLYRQKLIENRNLFKGQNYRKIFESGNLGNAYTVSYSPIRTLCYLNIFNIKPINFLSNLIALTQQQLNVFCFGSGPGENQPRFSRLIQS